MPRMLHGDLRNKTLRPPPHSGLVKTGNRAERSSRLQAIRQEESNCLKTCTAVRVTMRRTCQRPPERVSLKHLQQKFPAGTLSTFCEIQSFTTPDSHADRLSEGEANQLAAFLSAHAETESPTRGH